MSQEELYSKILNGENRFNISEIAGLDLSHTSVKIDGDFVFLYPKKTLSLLRFNIYSIHHSPNVAWVDFVNDVISRPNYYLNNTPDFDLITPKQ